MMVADTTETCRNMDWLCENFRITKSMAHIVNNLQKNTSGSYFKTIILQCTHFLWHSRVKDLREKCCSYGL
jgi:glutamate racemase